MLVVKRRAGEDVVIGEGADPIRVRVVGIKGNQVLVGVTAPRSVRVLRHEVHERIECEREREGEQNQTRVVCVGEGLA